MTKIKNLTSIDVLPSKNWRLDWNDKVTVEGELMWARPAWTAYSPYISEIYPLQQKADRGAF